MEQTKDLAPKIHNLVRLAELAKQEFTETEWRLLADVNEFNMASRYPEAKYAFYKKCDKKYTDKYYENIKNLYTKLWQKNQ